MDLKGLDAVAGCNAGAEVTIYDPRTDKPTDIKIRVYGPDSDVVQRLRRAQTDRTMAKMRKGNRRVDTEEIERQYVDFLAKATLGWSGLEEDGKPLEFTFNNAVRIYTAYPVLKDQVDRFIGDRVNFMKG